MGRYLIFSYYYLNTFTRSLAVYRKIITMCCGIYIVYRNKMYENNSLKIEREDMAGS